MCQRLYIASRAQLPAVKKTQAAPHLELHRAGGKEAASVQRHFATSEFPFLYVAGAHAPCGCGFPEKGPGSKRAKAKPEDGKTMEALQRLLSKAVGARPRVKLLLCFIGTEDEDVAEGRTIGLSELADPEFRLQNLEVVTILKAPQNKRMQLTGPATRAPRS